MWAAELCEEQAGGLAYGRKPSGAEGASINVESST